ncbi:MAG: SCO family protein [Chitinophagaceae bacterium]|nr:SCO family protein [Chitinophagaceae bacterium]
MTKSRIRSVLLGSLLTVLVPLGAYWYLKSNGYNGRVPLPKHYGIAKIVDVKKGDNVVKDTLYRVLQDLRLVNQLGDSVSLNSDLKGKMLIVNFFFTNCTTICPVMSHNMQKLVKALKKEDSILQFISISVDPENDSVPRLRDYANRLDVNHDTWYFMTGNKSAIYNYARTELELKVPQAPKEGNDFIHPEQFVLIDKYRNIRGYYNGLDSNKVRQCAEDVAYLMVEKNSEHERKK